MRISASRLAALGLLLLLALAGCNQDVVNVTPPDIPRYLPATLSNPISVFVLASDTAGAHPPGKLPVRFSWQTDRTTNDMLYFGPAPDSLRDSTAAQLIETGTEHGHAVGPLFFPAGSSLHYRVRSLGLNGLSAFTPVEVFLVRISAPGRLAGR